MNDSRIQRFLTNRDIYDEEHPNYYLVRMINVTLILVLGALFYSLVITLFFIKTSDIYIYPQILLFLMSIFLLYDFKKNNQILKTSIWTFFILTIAVWHHVLVMKCEGFSMVWLFILPPTSYFLLGKKVGTYFTVLYIPVVTIFLYLMLPLWSDAEFNIQTILNFLGVFVFIWVLIINYETNREQLYRVLKNKNSTLEALSITDTLTGLYNRNKIDELIDQAILTAKKHKTTFSILMADLDDFKEVNDNFGHLIGDEVLIKATKTLLKNKDTNDDLGRWGGEEFIMICYDKDLKTAKQYAEMLRKNFAKEPMTDSHYLTISFGVTEYRKFDTIDSLIKRADLALYNSKGKGRNKVSVL